VVRVTVSSFPVKHGQQRCVVLPMPLFCRTVTCSRSMPARLLHGPGVLALARPRTYERLAGAARERAAAALGRRQGGHSLTGAVRAHPQRRHALRWGGEGRGRAIDRLLGNAASPVSATVRLVSRRARPPAGRPCTGDALSPSGSLICLLVPATSGTDTVLPLPEYQCSHFFF
jgi:hypothetical protein